MMILDKISKLSKKRRYLSNYVLKICDTLKGSSTVNYLPGGNAFKHKVLFAKTPKMINFVIQKSRVLENFIGCRHPETGISVFRWHWDTCIFVKLYSG